MADTTMDWTLTAVRKMESDGAHHREALVYEALGHTCPFRSSELDIAMSAIDLDPAGRTGSWNSEVEDC